MPPLGHLERVLSTKVVSQLREGNSVAVTVLKSGFCAKLRHMNRTHRISVAGLAELIEPREIELKPTETENQLADIATMPLVKAKFVSAREQLCVVSSDQIDAIRGKNGHTHTQRNIGSLQALAFVRVAAQDLVILKEIWIWSMARFDANYGAVALSE